MTTLYKKDLEYLGKNLKRVREYRNLTSHEVAYYSCINHDFYVNIEKGRVESSFLDFSRIAKILDVDVRSFFCDEIIEIPRLPQDEAIKLWKDGEISMGRLAEILRMSISETRELLIGKNYE